MTYNDFIALAREVHAWNILETWTISVYISYIKEFGPMTKEKAIDICLFVENN